MADAATHRYKVGDIEVIVVTDTYEHERRLESYQRLSVIATTIEIKPAPVGV